MDDAKQQCRAAALARRDALSPADRSRASALIADRIRARPAWREARCILAYCQMRSEVDTSSLLAAVLAAGHTLLLPRVDWAARNLLAVPVTSLAQLAPARYGVPEPHDGEPVPPATADLVLVPGVAFDTRGGRVGYGAGFYDRLLAALPARVPRWGLAFEAQVVDSIPAEVHDQRVDAVVTESHWWEVARDG